MGDASALAACSGYCTASCPPATVFVRLHKEATSYELKACNTSTVASVGAHRRAGRQARTVCTLCHMLTAKLGVPWASPAPLTTQHTNIIALLR